MFAGDNGVLKAAFFNANGTLGTKIQSYARDGVQTLGQTVSVDVNGDGIADRIFNQAVTRAINASNAGTLISLGQAGGTFAAPTTTTSWYGDSDMFYGDINGDGRADLVMDFQRAGNKFYVGLGQSSGKFSALNTLAYNPGFGTTGKYSLADINGDGRQELVFTGNDGVLKAAFFNADGSVGSTIGSVMVNGQHTLGQAFKADINGDGIADSVLHMANHRLLISLGQASGLSGPAMLHQVMMLEPAANGGPGWNNYSSWKVHVGDVNGDGRADLVSEYLNPGDRRLWVQLGRNDGTFGAFVVNEHGYAGSKIGGNNPLSLADIDGNGRSEVVRTGDDGSMTATFFNADGTVGSTISSVLRDGQQTLGQTTMADVNGDGILDSIFNGMNGYYGTTRISLGRADGSFAPASSTYSRLCDNSDMSYGDVNGDGRADLVMNYGRTGNSFHVALGQQDGSFSYWNVWGKDFGWGNAGTYSLQDINGDNRSELVFQGTDGSLRAAFFKADGTVDTTISSVLRDGQQTLGQTTMADVNGDGILDSIFNGVDGYWTTRISLGRADGTFAPASIRESWFVNSDMSYGDVNGDGRADLVMNYLRTGTLFHVALGQQDGSFSYWNVWGKDFGWGNAGTYSLQDINGDNRSELVFQGTDGSLRAAFFNADGSVWQTIDSRKQDGIETLGNAWQIDINGDGITDRLFERVDKGDSWETSIVSMGRADGTFATPYLTNGWLLGRETLWGDITGDGKADDAVLLWERSGNRTAHFGVGNGTGAISWAQAHVNLGTGDGTYQLADLNGDGRQELLFTALDGSLKATFFNANGTLASTLNSVARHGVQSLGQQISADFNGDGVLDSIWRQGSNNSIQVAYGTKNASTGVVSYGVWQNVSGAIPTGGTFSDNLFALDLNGDLKSELIWVKSGAGGATTGAATVLRNTTAQGAPAWSVNNTSGNTTGMSNASPGIVSFEDVNGDGRLDLIRTTAPGYESVFLGQTNGGLGALLTMNKVEIKTPSDSTNYDLSASSNTQATIYGNALGQTITGTNWNDSIYGFDGNDTLNGGAGNDTLEGGIGNDTLNGGAGADTYLFTRGDGQDTIQDSDQTAGLNDVLQFETTVSANQLWFRKAGATNDLEISVIGTVDKVTVKD